MNLVAAYAEIFFFVGAIGSYSVLGAKGKTTNQFENPMPGTRAYMAALIIAEIGGTIVLLAGFVDGQML